MHLKSLQILNVVYEACCSLILRDYNLDLDSAA